MIALDSGSFHTVSDPEQARLLSEPTSKTFFKPFLARERTASEAAAELGCGLNTVIYRIKTFLAAGLLEVTHETRRKGRAIKHYRSHHDAYFIPFTLTPYATLEERLEAQAAPIFSTLLGAYADALKQSAKFGNYLLRAPDGAVWTTDLTPATTPAGLPLLYTDTVLHLGKDEAAELAGTLRALVPRTSAGESEATRKHPYFFMVALLPLTN